MTKRERAVDGPREKIAGRRTCACAQVCLCTGVVLNPFRLRQGGLLPARAGLGHSLRSAPACVGLVENSGWVSKGLSFYIRLRLAWWWMGAGNGRMWVSAPTGVMKTRRPGNHTGPPLIPSRRGRRPRRPAFTAGPAPAERKAGGIRDFPGLEDSPGAPRLMRTTTRKD